MSSDAASNSRKQGRNNDPQELFSDERRAELFQFLLRDLQVEGVPILAVDTADQWAPFQAALWTTMSTLYMSTMSSETENAVEDVGATKVCLVFEDTPMEYLRLFVQEFREVQQHSFTASPKVSATGSTAVSMHHLLPELDVFEVSLLGNGVGPAILLAAKPHSRGKDEVTGTDENGATSADTAASNEERMIESMERFVGRIFVQPKLKANNAGRHIYRSCRYGDAYHVMSSFWNAICELERMHEQQQESVLSESIAESSSDNSCSMFLLLPRVASCPTPMMPVAVGEPDQMDVKQKRRRQYHDRWYALTLVQSRSLRLNEEATKHIQIQQYYPDYERDWRLESEDLMKERNDGHLPPNAIVHVLSRALHRHQENSGLILSTQELTTVIDSISSMSDAEMYQIVNYLRRSPVPAVYLERRVGSSSLLDTNQPSRGDNILRSVLQLLQAGTTLSLLQSSLDEEMSMTV